MGAQSWTNTCGVCHVGGGQMEYDRDLNEYSTGSEPGDRYVMKYARLSDGNATNGDETSWDTVSEGWLSDTNKAEMDCLMCHLDGSNAGSAWLKTLDCGPGNPIGPMADPDCSGISDMGPAFRTVTVGDGVTDYDMYNRNFGLKQRRNDLIASMGAGAKGVFGTNPDDNTTLVGVDWGATAVETGGDTTGVGTCVDGDTIYNVDGCGDYSYQAFTGGSCEGLYGTPYYVNGPSVNCIKVEGTQLAATPKSENCSVCHARDDNTMGLPGMAAMKTGFGNYGLIHDPSNSMTSGNMGSDFDLDTDNGPGAANDDYWFDFGCKTGMGKRAHKITATGDEYGVNGRYGMSMFLPSTLDADPLTVPNMGDPVPGKMPDIDVHDRNGMECASCHYAVGSTTGTGYEVIPAGEHHGFDYPAETVYAMDHQFAQADSFPDTKGKNNLDAKIRCDGCHTVRDNPKITDNGGTLVAPTPLHDGLPQVHLDLIGCVTCHVPETYSAPGRLKYRDWTAGFARGTFRNVLDWNFNLVEGNHNTVPMPRKWASKNGETKIYPVLPSLLPTWYEMVPNSGVLALNIAGDANTTRNDAGMAVDADLYDSDPLLSYPSPVKNRDLQRVGEWVRDMFDGDVNATHNPDGLDFDMRLNGGNTVPLFDGFQIVDSWEVDTADEINAMLTAFNNQENGSDARYVSYLNVIQADFDVTHGVVPKEWALGGSERGGCVSCHSSMAMSLDGGQTMNPNYSPFSIGFFEGYTQPVANAGLPGFAVGGYEMAKNWMAMFADFDAAMMCGMGDPTKTAALGDVLESMLTVGFGASDAAKLAPMMVNMMGDDGLPNHHNYYFNPMTNEPDVNATCSSMSWFSNNPMFGTTDDNATLAHVLGMMHSTFDQAMGFPSGASAQMGMNDGVAGIQGFTLKELQTGGTLGCNPFAGPISFSPMAGASVNNCVPNYADSTVAASIDPAFGPMLAPMALDFPGTASQLFAGMFNGSCNGAAPPTPGTCVNGFRHNGACFTDADCGGAMTDLPEIFHNPTGLFLSRSAAVSHFKQDLQQVFATPGDPSSSLVKWSAGGAQNPGNPAHVNSWDQAQYCYDRINGANPLTPNVEACISLADPAGPTGGMGSDGMGNLQIATAMSANQFLGYAPAKLASLKSASMLGIFEPVDDMLHDVHLNMETLSHLADPALLTSTVSCFDCHADISVGGSINATGTVGTVGIINDDNSFEATVSQYIGGPNAGQDYVTCTTACHHDGSQDGVETAEEQGTYVVARLTATNSRSQNNVITFDASESSCVGTCSFSDWNFSNCGTSIGGNGSDVVVMLDDNATTLCDGNVTVTSSYLGGSPTVVAVEIGADDTVVPEEMENDLVAIESATTDLDAYGNCVPVYTTTLGTATDLDLDMDWSSNVYVYWGDRTRTVTTAVELDNGTVTHEYDDNTTYTIRVSSKDVNWNITNEIVSTTFADNPCTP